MLSLAVLVLVLGTLPDHVVQSQQLPAYIPLGPGGQHTQHPDYYKAGVDRRRTRRHDNDDNTNDDDDSSRLISPSVFTRFSETLGKLTACKTIHL